MNTLTHKLAVMLDMQAATNTRVYPDWLKGLPFLRAALVEGAEALDHYGWKWWKKQEPDFKQFRMELIDIWHFALSHMLLVHKGDVQACAQAITTEIESAGEHVSPAWLPAGQSLELASLDMREKLETMIGMAACKQFSTALFFSIMTECGMSFEDLFKLYLPKNVLNFFRQDHGYKEGTYRKIWGGREDNEHLTEIFEQMNFDSPAVREEIYAALKTRYEATA